MSKHDFSQDFEKMRPYHDQEVNQAIRRLIHYQGFDSVLSFLFPGHSPEEKKKELVQIETVEEFQRQFMYQVVWSIVNQTSDGLRVEGQENLTPGTPYLFISNHRDIVLDAAILQIVLLDIGHQTSQITFGSNLMTSDLVVDFGKLNRMFTFYRGGTRAEMFRNALVHSFYIRDAIFHLKESVWIAQRSGRTKDGNDMTQSALIRMLVGRQADALAALHDLNIVPIAISYEFEPCDIEKARENFLSGKQDYQKEEQEDLRSILTGIVSPKGKINFSFGIPINQYLETLPPEKMPVNILCDLVAAEMDRQIHSRYQLYPNNYIASDMLADQPVFRQHYSDEEYQRFNDHYERKIREAGQEELRRPFLQIYTGPLHNKP